MQFIYLDGDFDLIWQRMQSRENHYMKPEMLRSQFEALEPPNKEEAIRVPVDRPVDDIMDLILQTISKPSI